MALGSLVLAGVIADSQVIAAAAADELIFSLSMSSSFTADFALGNASAVSTSSMSISAEWGNFGSSVAASAAVRYLASSNFDPNASSGAIRLVFRCDDTSPGRVSLFSAADDFPRTEAAHRFAIEMNAGAVASQLSIVWIDFEEQNVILEDADFGTRTDITQGSVYEIEFNWDRGTTGGSAWFYVNGVRASNTIAMGGGVGSAATGPASVMQLG
ncbi:MAG: hypothetical protein ACXABY_13165, partial [Candidatus Thorarchaeota archaeon]